MTRMDADHVASAPAAFTAADHAPPTAPPVALQHVVADAPQVKPRYKAEPAASRPPTQLSREQILDATAACLAEQGYDATTIRTIARRLNCAVGSIYRYFADKRQLLAAVTQRAFLPVVEGARQGAAIRDTVQQYVYIAAADENAYRLMFFLAAVAPDGREDSIIAGADRRGGRMPAIVVRLIDQWARQLGDLAKARQLWSLVHGSVTIGQELTAILEHVRDLLGDAAESTGKAADAHESITRRSPQTASPVVAAARENVAADDVCLL
jgi:AcrR family transcriptional regulator